MRSLTLVQGLVPLAVLLAIWQIVGDPRSPYFPSPSSWFVALGELATSGRLLPAIGETFGVILLSVFLALIAGTALGLAVGLVPIVDAAVSPTLEFLRALPPPVLVPIATLAIGIEPRAVIVVAALTAFWPILLNMTAAVRGIHPRLRDSARMLRLSPFRIMRTILLPASLTGMLLGLRNAVPLAVVVTLLAEILTLVGGVGALVMVAQRSFSANEVFGLILVIALLGLLLSVATRVVETHLLRNRPH